MPPHRLAVQAARMFTPLEEYGPAVVLIEEGRIVAVGRQGDLQLPPDAEVIDVGDRILVPGFVDIHIHGAVGNRSGVTVESTLKIAEFLPSTGTTSWLPTVHTEERARNIVICKGKQERGAEIAGVHLEGPWLAPKGLPGSGKEEVPVPTVEKFRRFWDACGGHLRMMSIALELPNWREVVPEMRRHGVVPALAHSKVSYEEFLQGVAVGVRHVTHAYNVMSGLHHRRPGIVGGLLTNDQVTTELIADGHHVHPAAMDVLFRCKPPSQVCLITDHTQWTGLPDGEYESDYGVVVKKEGTVRFKGYDETVDHSLAGSVWPMNHCVRTAARVLGGNLRRAVQMATLTPATVAGLADRKGSIEPGKDADLTVIDLDVNVYLSMVRGQIQYRASDETIV